MIGLTIVALLQAAQVTALPVSPAQAAPPVIPVGVQVRPETVTVGDPFVVRLHVRTTKGSVIAFPPGPDSGQTIEAVDPRAIATLPDTTVLEQVATYRLVAWDTGAQPIALGEVVVSSGGAGQHVTVNVPPIYVRTVLPRDTALRVPKPAQDILKAPFLWWPWLLALLALIGLLWWLIWWLRRRRPAPAIEDASTAAERALARIETLQLIEAGEAGRYVALHTDVLRDYLAARVEGAERSLTSGELLAALRGKDKLPLARMTALLSDADAIKFARRSVSGERAREVGREVRAVITATERAVTPEPEAVARERAA